MNEALAIYQLAKIFVLCHKKCVMFICALQHHLVGNARLHFSNIKNNVPVLPKPLNNRPVHALVSQEIHAACSTIG